MGRALVRDPKIFLFDEPLSNLDAKLRVEMRREIKKLHQKLKTTVVYVTHDQTEAMSLGTKIAIMNHGVIQQCDSPKTIYKKPQNVFVADFIGSPSMNLINGSLNTVSNTINFECVDSKGSNQIPVETYNFIKKNNYDNRKVLFGIRPEHMYLSKNNKNDYQIELKTILSEYIGHEQIITFNYYDQELVGKFSSSVDIPMDKKFNLFFDLDQISIFDKETGERL
jgi:multiple sugar transport system ATP-binding protein